MGDVVPTASLQRRMPEVGRIRLGIKGPRGEPRSLRTLRFTSTNHEAIQDIARLYGGTPSSWNPRGQRTELQVITSAAEVPIVLPPDPLGGTPIYELWSGGGWQRRCDGVTCQLPVRTPDGSEVGEVACQCDAEKRMACKPITRLSVVLAEIAFGGTWRLEAGGWNAAKELPGMVDMIQLAQTRGLTKAMLGVRAQSQIQNGQTRNFVVPYLRLDDTLEEIAEGKASLRALAVVPEIRQIQGAWPAPPTEAPDDTDPPDIDGEVVEAELVDDEPPAAAVGHVPLAERVGLVAATALENKVTQIAIRCRELSLTDDDRHTFAFTVSDGRTSSTRELSADEADRVLVALRRLAAGEVTYAGIIEGRAVIRRRPD